MPRRHLHLRQTVAGCVNKPRRPKEGVSRATVHNEPQHLVDDLPNTEEAQGMRRLLGRELDHRGVCEATQSSDILRGLGTMTRTRSRSRYLGDERFFKCWLLSARKRRQIRAEIVGHRETTATSG